MTVSLLASAGGREGDNSCGRTASTDGDDGCVTVKATGGGGAWSVTSYSGEQIPSIQPSWSPGSSSFLFRSKMAWKKRKKKWECTYTNGNVITFNREAPSQAHTLPKVLRFWGGGLVLKPPLSSREFIQHPFSILPHSPAAWTWEAAPRLCFRDSYWATTQKLIFNFQHPHTHTHRAVKVWHKRQTWGYCISYLRGEAMWPGSISQQPLIVARKAAVFFVFFSPPPFKNLQHSSAFKAPQSNRQSSSVVVLWLWEQHGGVN